MSADHPATRSKVARLIEEHGLTELGEQLEQRWTRAEDRDSLRTLATFFNQELLRERLRANGVEPVDGEAENLYRLLTDETVTGGNRQESRSRLQRRGVDVESLQSEFVSYQSIRTYLQNYRDVPTPSTTTPPGERTAQKRETIERLSDRLVTVTERSLDDLRESDAITLGEFDLILNMQVYCEDCGTQRTVVDLLESEKCECSPDRA